MRVISDLIGIICLFAILPVGKGAVWLVARSIYPGFKYEWQSTLGFLVGCVGGACVTVALLLIAIVNFANI